MSSNRLQWIDSTPPTLRPVRLGRLFEVGGQNQYTKHGNGTSMPPRAPKPKRQRIRPAPGDQSAGNQTFYFVDSSNSSSREKRAHAMRHRIEKRQKLLQDSRDDINGESNRTVDDPSDYKSNALGRNESGSRSEHEHAGIGSQLEATLSRRSSTDPHLASPKTILDASRKDPFHTLPIIASRDDLELADYWTSRLSYWSGQNPHIKNVVFRTAMNHPLAFQAAILSYCARWKTQIYGLKDSVEVQHHMDQIGKGIEEARKGTMAIDQDSLAVIFTGLALQEERFGSAKTAEEHASQAVQILRPRTGPKTAAEVHLHYVRYMIIPPNPAIDTEGRQWLVTFLRGAEELMEDHSTDAYLAVAPARRTAFHMGSPLFPLLSTGPHPTRVPPELRMYVLQNAPTQDISRNAALIYITAALWDFRHSLSKTNRFLAHLFAIVREHRLDRDPACETLVWALLEETCDMDLRDPERAWSTAELLNISKQLPPALQFQFSEILMSFLQLMRPVPDVNTFEKELQKRS